MRRPSVPYSTRRGVAAGIAAVALIAGCATPPRPTPPVPTPPGPTPPIAAEPTPPATTPPTPSPPAPGASAPWQAATFDELPGWSDDDIGAGLLAFVQGCTALQAKPGWDTVCAQARSVTLAPGAEQRRFLETAFTPWRVTTADGRNEGLLTGYYEPLLRGSRTPTDVFRFPVYTAPDDLITVELGEVVPETKGLRLRGRVVGRKLVPYWTRADIDGGGTGAQGREIAWVDDAVDLFFLQIQGSGRIRLDDGSMLRVGYADQNGHPYRSIGRLLVERGEMPLEKASMQGIKDWGKRNPDRLQALLDENPSYVFFRELPSGNDGPPGALGVPLTAGRSIAVDPKSVPLGAPVWLVSTWPNAPEPLRRLVAAQDTGGAIRGAVRADYFWGFGDQAGELAGRMRQPLQLWVLWPIGMTPPAR
ncbi:MAG: MltA domain-containing protein [Burkholderiales bacterium]|nr:MltA domain-containing protein [Burkholderiales bacterium]